MKVLRLFSPGTGSTTTVNVVLPSVNSHQEWGRVIRASAIWGTAGAFGTPERPVLSLVEASPFNQRMVFAVGPLLTRGADVRVCASIGGFGSDALQRLTSGVGFEAMLQSADFPGFMSFPLGLLAYQVQTTLRFETSDGAGPIISNCDILVAIGSPEEIFRLG